MNGITRTLAAYVAASRYDKLPAEIRHEGVRAFVNWVGCAAGGAHEAIVERALEVLSEFNGAAAATLVGRSEKLDALNATFINSMSSSALAFNDTHFTTVAHPTSPVAAAALACAERMPVSGRELMHAIVLGNEIQCRVGNILCAPPAQCQVGLSMAGLVGGIGAAVAAAKLLGLDQAGVATAIGLAANQASGLRETHATMGSHFTPGNAARGGLLAALLAARGFTCSDQVLEGPKGFAACYGQQPNLEAAIDKLGQVYEMSSVAYKPYPSGFVVHPIIDACLDIARANAIDAAQIERIELEVTPLAVQLTNRPEPKDRSQALVSLQHWAACALIHKAAGVAQLADAVLRDPAVSELRRKVTFTALPSLGPEAASASVLLKNGKRIEASVQHCRGSTGRPMTDADITEKTCAQLEAVFDAPTAAAVTAECWRIEDYPRADALAPRLARPR